MTVSINFRTFDTQADADAYLRGYDSYPKWPNVGVNGSVQPAPINSPEATGYFDKEERYELNHSPEETGADDNDDEER